MFSAQSLIKSSSRKNQSGQGIIEIVVVLGLAAILILSLVALSVRSNRSANFSKAEDQAARFSQEGMEYLRNMRDSGTATVNNLSGCAPVNNWTCIFPHTFSTGEVARFTSGTTIIFDGTHESFASGGRNFERWVVIRDDVSAADNPCNLGGDAARIKQFTVAVSWSDTSGVHTSTTNSCLQQN